MNEDEFLDHLLDPKDDRAWKIAAGVTLYRMLEQVSKTNGRVSQLELWRAGLIGGLAVVSAIVVPLFLHTVWGLGK